MDMADRLGQMELVMRGHGSIIKLRAKAHSSTQTATVTQALGYLTKLTVGALMCTETGRSMRASGKMISNMDMGLKSGLMKVNMRDIMSWARNTDKVKKEKN
jgi:hypothetical protein